MVEYDAADLDEFGLRHHQPQGAGIGAAHRCHARADITPELEHRKSGYVERKRRPYQGNVVRIA